MSYIYPVERRNILVFLVPFTLLTSLSGGQQYNLTGSAQAAVLGQSFTWTCSMFIPPGETINAVTFYRNNTKCGSIGRNKNNGNCATIDTDPRYTFQCLSSEKYTLTIPSQNMTDYEQNTVWRCEYINSGAFKSHDVTLNIAIDVNNISLNPSDNLLRIREGSQLVVRCAVNSNAFPVPTITWILGSTDITNTAGSDKTTILITGNRVDNRKRLECRATNNNKQPKNASTTLNIEYKPELAINPSSLYKIREGQTAIMTCQVRDANPITGITWSWIKTSNPSVLYNGENFTIPNIQRGQAGTYQCTATNSIGASEPATVQVDVQYKPQVSITTSNPYKITEGQTATLTCIVTAANPNTSITWRWIKTDKPNTVIHGGFTYTVSNIKREKSGTYTCTGANFIGTSEPGSVQVDVQYKPQVGTTTSNPYKITEGQTANLTCIVTAANPNTSITWRWVKTDQPNNVLYTGPTYTIPNIQRGQSGTYRCTATNSIGTSAPATVQVDVQYKPQVSTTISNPYKITEGQTANLMCVVTAANPNTVITWKWVKTDQPNTVLHSGSSYTIPNIQRGQSGTYKCSANNSIGISEPATVQVDVQYVPSKVTLYPDVKVINVKENETVTPIDCSAVCNPTCLFTWTRVGMPTVNSGRLELGQLKRSDRGTYTCTASNSISSTSTAISVIVNYPPKIEMFQTSNGQDFEEGSPFNITCIVDSYPFSDINITNIDTGELKVSGGSVESLTYREPSAKCYQTANYSCHSNNVYGSTSSKIQTIFILCRPRPADGQLTLSIGIKAGDGLNISTKFIGYPLPHISWIFKKNLADDQISLPDIQQMYSVPLNVSTILTGITKETLNLEEFGYYVVTATIPGNSSQFSTVTFHVMLQRKPYPPYNIFVNCNVSRGTAVVNWKPGFDGGAEQMFLVSYRTCDGDQKRTTEKHLHPNVTLVGLKYETVYNFKVIASNVHGETFSEEEKSCKTIGFQASEPSAPESKVEGIIGGTFGGVVLAALVVLLIFINRKYQIKCLERNPNPSGKTMEVSDNISETLGLRSEMSAQYEELKQNSGDKENSYDSITSPNKNRTSGAAYEDLQPEKEEYKYEEFTGSTGGKDSTYTNSKMMSPANVYLNMSFK